MFAGMVNPPDIEMSAPRSLIDAVLEDELGMRDLNRSTNAVVAICVVLVPRFAVGAVGTPVSVGDSVFANDAATNAVVAICVLFVPADAVGAVGVPVRTGDANGAYDESDAEVM